MPDELRSTKLYFELRILPNYLAANGFPDKLIEFLSAELVGVKADEGPYRTKAKPPKPAITKRLVLSSNIDALKRLESLANGEDMGALGLRAFEDDLRKIDAVSLTSAGDVGSGVEGVDFGDSFTWEAVLHPQGNEGGRSVPISGQSLERWHQAVNFVDGEVYENYERTVGGITFSPVSLTFDEARKLSRFNGLRALRPLPKIRPRPGFGSRSVATVLAPSTQEPLRDEITVAVFDGGVETMGRRRTFFSMPEFDVTPVPPDSREEAHGTAVVGAALYGLVKEGTRAPRPAVKLDSYRVFPAPDVNGDLWGYWILDQIVEIVRREKYKMVNLSLGPQKSVEDFAEPDRWTSELDQLADELGVLFIVAAGNGGEYDRNGDFHRVQVPADMVNGLTVGSCTVPHPEKKWSRAPYSSMGPGRHGARIQPTGVQYGGTVDEMMPLLRGDGSLMENYGTSFAAPLMTHALGRLAAEFPTFNANTLRAFAIHFAERHRAFQAKVNEFGFGRFLLDYTSKLDSNPDEVHVLFEDSAVRSALLGYQVPLPGRVTGDLELRITLSYTSPIDAAQSTDYTNSSVDLTFRPHSEIRVYTSPVDESTTKALDRRSDEAFQLITAGWKDSQEARALSLTALADKSEVKLREAGKWETLRHYRVNLPAGSAYNPRVEVSYLARRGGMLEGNVPDLPFSMLITVVEPGATDLHEEVAKAFPSLQALSKVPVPLQLQNKTV